MKNAPLVIKVALAFMLVNALMWFVIGVLIAVNVHPGVPDDAALKSLMMLGMFGGAVILALLYLLLRRGRQLAFFITLVVLAVIIMLTLFDQIGWADLIGLALAFVPFALLIVGRKWYLQAN